ncbi:MAG: hypothetical protein K8I60_11440, partial [Anaerolineae bacterium]|nr:hypothetical protein [Anaerolineae bacterium]
RIAPDDKNFAFWDQERNLFLGDIEQRVIYDLCFRGDFQSMSWAYGYEYPNLAWSADNRSLAFSYHNRLIILDTRTFENQVIDTHSRSVLGWGSLESEALQPDTGRIHPPQATPTPIPTVTPVPTQPPPTVTPQVNTCQLEVVAGANLRAGAGVEYERVGSSAIGSVLAADAQQFNTTEYFRWWRLTTGEWIREDFVKEDESCAFLPEPTPTP